MFRRAAMTILLPGRHSLVRADFAGGRRPRLIDLWQQNRPDLDDPASLVEQALSPGPKPGRRVWVLDAGLWTQSVYPTTPLPPSLPPADVARALAFEAEQLSGIGGLDSVVGQVPLPPGGNERGYWIVQARAGDFLAIEEAVRRAGGTLAGLTHPAGLPRPLESSAGPDGWQRVELWPELVALIHGGAGKPARVALIHGDPQQGRWRVEEARWQEQVGAVAGREILTMAGDLTFLDGEGRLLSQVEGVESLKLWLTAWAEQLSGAPEMVPLIRPAPRPMTQRQRLAVAGLLGLLTAGACYGHNHLVTTERAELQAEMQRVKEPAVRLAALQKQMKDMEAKRDQAKKEVDQLKQNLDALQTQRHRLAALLRSLAEHPPPDVVIRKIDADGTSGNPGVQGLCLRSQLADQFARNLAAQLRPLGWQVHQSKHQSVADGSLSSFELRFQAIEPEAPPPPRSSTVTAVPPPTPAARQ